MFTRVAKIYITKVLFTEFDVLKVNKYHIFAVVIMWRAFVMSTITCDYWKQNEEEFLFIAFKCDSG